MSRASNHSAIWSSLFTLDTVLLPDSKEFHLNKRHHKLATAVACIGASSTESKTVTACSSEVRFLPENDQPIITLRITQNQPIAEAEMGRFQNLLNVLITEVRKCNAREWNVKEDRVTRIQSIVEDVFLPLVVERCRTKITAILGDFYSEPFQAWYKKKHSAYLNSVPREKQNAFAGYFELVNMALVNTKDQKLLSFAIVSAQRITSAGIASQFALERQWTEYDTSKTTGEENTDDCETLDEGDIRKSSIHRFLHKLARYYTSCYIIVRELAALHRAGHNLDISIATVPILQTTSAPKFENEYPKLSSFLKDCMGVDRKILDSGKIDKLACRWGTASGKEILILHAEMQLALFYATDPEFYPIQGYIGVSKKSCWCCDFVLKHLQIPFPHEEAGSLLEFSHSGTHGTKNPQWLFPDPSKHIKSTLEESAFRKVCHRFELVREELQQALLQRVRAIMPELRKVDDESDSSGMSDDDDGPLWNQIDDGDRPLVYLAQFKGNVS